MSIHISNSANVNKTLIKPENYNSSITQINKLARHYFPASGGKVMPCQIWYLFIFMVQLLDLPFRHGYPFGFVKSPYLWHKTLFCKWFNKYLHIRVHFIKRRLPINT